MQNGYVECFNDLMRDELLVESLFFGLDYVRSAVVEWADDYNDVRPHSSLGYQTPVDCAGIIASTGSNITQCGSLASPPVAHRAIYRIKIRRGSYRWMKLDWPGDGRVENECNVVERAIGPKLSRGKIVSSLAARAMERQGRRSPHLQTPKMNSVTLSIH